MSGMAGMRGLSESPLEGLDPEKAGAAARVLREFIRTPTFLEMVKTNLPRENPEAARQLIRTFLWEDAMFSLSIVQSLPAVFNNLVEALMELGRQLDHFSDDLLEEFVTAFSGEMGTGSTQTLAEVYGPLLSRMLVENEETRAKLTVAFYEGANGFIRAAASFLETLEDAPPASPAVRSSGLDMEALAEAINRSARLIRRSASAAGTGGRGGNLEELLDHIDFGEVAGAALAVTGAVLRFTVRLVSKLVGSALGALR